MDLTLVAAPLHDSAKGFLPFLQALVDRKLDRTYLKLPVRSRFTDVLVHVQDKPFSPSNHALQKSD